MYAGPNMLIAIKYKLEMNECFVCMHRPCNYFSSTSIWPLLHFGFQLKFSIRKGSVLCCAFGFLSIIERPRIGWPLKTDYGALIAPSNQSIAVAAGRSGDQSILLDVIVLMRLDVTRREQFLIAAVESNWCSRPFDQFECNTTRDPVWFAVE